MLAASVIVTWALRHKISKFLGAHSNLQGVCRNLLQFGPVVRSWPLSFWKSCFLRVLLGLWQWHFQPGERQNYIPWAVWRKKTDRNTRDVASDSSINSCFCKKGCEKLKPKSTRRWLPRNSDAIPRKVSSSWHGLLQIYPPGHKPKSFWIDNFFFFQMASSKNLLLAIRSIGSRAMLRKMVILVAHLLVLVLPHDASAEEFRKSVSNQLPKG